MPGSPPDIVAAIDAHRAGRLSDAERIYRAVIADHPAHADAHNLLGSVALELGRLPLALSAIARAIRMSGRAEYWSNLGLTYQAAGRIQQAALAFSNAIALNPDHVGARWNMSLLLLLMGDYAAGWREYEWRWRRPATPLRQCPEARWDGRPLDGAAILLHAEQGFGDTIQFLRYVPLVAAQGGRVILEVQPELRSLVQGLDGVASVHGRGDPLPPFDVECPLMSLPLAFGTLLDRVPGAVPYLRPDPAMAARWGERLGDGPGPKVGLVWAGNPLFRGDRSRSPGLRALQPLLDLPDIRFFGLQMGAGRRDLPPAGGPSGFVDLGPEIHDFADTAAIMANLDLVVSSCTAPAHLAGSLGVPVWVALPFAPDWRWLLERADSPWYPTARLFRQPAPGDWATPFMAMAEALRNVRKRAR